MTEPLHIRVDRKAFAERVVLAHMELDVRPREVIALIGPSGCGKSTLLRIAAGLECDYFGQVRLGAEPVLAPRPELGIMFQEPRLLPWLTVIDNVVFGQPASQQVRQRALALLEEVGLREFANTLPKQLSGGMAQRVSLARALARQPHVLLLDEPFSAVDAMTRMILQDLLLEVAQRHGTSVLIVTHDIEEALVLADRVIVMPATPGARVSEIVNFERPRQRADASLARLRNAVLGELRGASLPLAPATEHEREIGR